MADGASHEVEPLKAADPSRVAADLGDRLPRLHGVSVLAFVAGLLVTAALAIAAWSTHEGTEDRILDRRTREAAAVLTTGISTIQSSVSSLAEVVSATEGDVRSFETLAGSLVGEEASFVSASLWTIADDEPRRLAVVGADPALESSGEDLREALGRSQEPGLKVIPLLTDDTPRIGYLYGRAQPGPFVAYVEAALPEDRRSVPQASSAFADLRYAIYLDERDSDHLVVADTADLPLDGRSARQALDLGDRRLILEMQATGVVGSKLGAALPWLILAAGALLSFGFALLYERVLHRRDHAAVLALELSHVARDNARLYEEQRSVAQTLQQSLLLEELPRVPGLELAARYEAGSEGVDVGGDWYDMIIRDEDCVLLVVGDVSGRGVRAATVMAALRHSIRALALQGEDVASILTKLSSLVSVAHDGHFATVLMAEIDPRRGSLAVASAGHPRPIVFTDAGARFIEVETGVPVGISKDPQYATVDWQVEPGATLLGFTDGLFERRGETIDTGLERLRAAVEESRDEPLDRLLDVILERFAGSPEDDAAILGVRWPG